MGTSAILPYVWIVHHKNRRHFHLVAHSFTKLSHNVSLISIQILKNWHAWCNLKLWKALWFYCDFSGILIHYWRVFMSKKYCIFIKLSQIVCLINIHIFYISICQKLTAGYERFSDFIAFFRAFSYIITCLKRYNFIKLLKIVC